MFLKYIEKILPNRFFVVCEDGSVGILLGRPILHSDGKMIPSKNSAVFFAIEQMLPHISKDKLALLLGDAEKRREYVDRYGHMVICEETGTLWSLGDRMHDTDYDYLDI